MDKEMLHMDEQIVLLEKMLERDEAIEKLASMELVEMPEYLAEEILDSILLEEIQAEEPAGEHVVLHEKAKLWSKWFQLFCYSAKVAFATACAIVMLFNLPDMQEIQTNREPVKYEKTSYVADVFDFISEKIFNGGLKNEK